MRTCLTALLLASVCTSCYSYKIFPKEYRNYVYEGQRKTAFVLNPELEKEYGILKASGIFILTTDSLNGESLKLRLHPLGSGFVCGQPVLASLFTLGQVPVYLPDTYSYRFEEIGRDTTLRKIELKIATRVWFWDLFAFPKKFRKKAGMALLAAYYNE